MVGVDRQGLFAVGNGFLEITPGKAGEAEVAVGHGQIRVKGDGLQIGLEALFEIPLLEEEPTHVDVGLGEVGFMFEGLFELGQCFLDQSLVRVGETQVVVERNRLGLEE